MKLPAFALLAFTAPLAPFASGESWPGYFVEDQGLVVIEAEAYATQELHALRQWEPVADDPLAAAAGGEAYLHLLPDTRITHDDPFRAGLNFSNEPGVLAVLTYLVEFTHPGRYYVWVRAYTTGSEDNSIHTGLNGSWPESGRRMQWCEGQHQWRWESLQRTAANHCGEPYLIFLDVPTAGRHRIAFSMREDGFRFDRFLLTLEREYPRPEALGPPASAYVDLTRDADERLTVEGERMTWHPIQIDLHGPWASETDIAPNPFLDYRFAVEFTHASGEAVYTVPGFFAADGQAAESSAREGRVWRARFTPDRPGQWTFRTRFFAGQNAAVDDQEGHPVAPYHDLTGAFAVRPTDKTGRDFRGQGRLEFVGERYLRFAGSGDVFLKMGADAPETLLAYHDFDGTRAGKADVPLKTWSPHFRDAQPHDPTWQNGKGRGLLGALNYLAAIGANAISFLTYNAGGDGDNVWPYVARDDKVHFDVSKLAQWERVFRHAQANGLYLHFKLQENELDDERGGSHRFPRSIPTALDGGKTGIERKLYLREMIARFGHHLALNWNLGEETTQTIDEIRAMAEYIEAVDPYDHHRIIHTFPEHKDQVYAEVLKHKLPLTGPSIQTRWDNVHAHTLQWLNAAKAAGQVWVVANDEQGPYYAGVPPDPGYEGFSGTSESRAGPYDLHSIRKYVLWGNLMAGGAGVEYYFGYRLPQNDLNCEDFRSREQSWRYGRIALDFFQEQNLPLSQMQAANELARNEDTISYVLAQPDHVYLLYAHGGGTVSLDLREASGRFTALWFNPRTGDYVPDGSSETGWAGRTSRVSPPAALDPAEDWVLLLKKI